MRISRVGPLLLCVLFCLGATPAAADTIYLDETTFRANAGPLTMESFEALALSSDVASVDVGAFMITTATTALRVRSDNVLGSFPTDGVRYVRWDSTTARSVVYTFDTPINRFGLTLTDALDGGGFIALTTNGGAIFPMALSGFQPSGSIRFLGLIADNPFTQLTLTVSGADGIGMDEVLYSNAQVSQVPEPISLLLLGTGAAGLLAKARSWKKQRDQ